MKAALESVPRIKKEQEDYDKAKTLQDNLSKEFVEAQKALTEHFAAMCYVIGKAVVVQKNEKCNVNYAKSKVNT